MHICDTYICNYLQHSTFRFNLTEFQLNTNFLSQFCVFVLFFVFVFFFLYRKIKGYIITRTKEKPSTTKLILFAKWVRQRKSKVKNADFECRYIRTHTKEKQFIITFAILPFYQKQLLKLNDHPEYFGTSTTPNEQMVHFHIKT